MRLLFLLLLCVGLSGCSTLSVNYDGPDAGYAVLSIVSKGPSYYSSYGLKYERQSGGGKAGFYVSQPLFSRDGLDYNGPNEMGDVIVRPMKPGDYRIYNYDLFFNGGLSQSNTSSRQKFSIPFRIEEGKVTYLGQFHAHNQTGKLLGLDAPGGAYFTIHDRTASDLHFAVEDYPHIRTLPFHKSVVSGSSVRHPDFR